MFVDFPTANLASLDDLTIFNSIGAVVGISFTSSSVSLQGRPAVTWTFDGGLQIIDTSTYIAELSSRSIYPLDVLNIYANGSLTENFTPNTNFDLIFEATFSDPTPVPFEFSPALGLVGLGALWLAKKKFGAKK